MPIHCPGPRLLTHVGLRCRGRVNPRRRSLIASLLLTPMNDVFIVIVLFLLTTFQASGEVCGCRDPVRRPASCHGEELERAPIISVSLAGAGRGIVTLDGAEMATVQELMSDERTDWNIARLRDQLEIKRTNWRLTHEHQRFVGVVIIDGDRETDFKVLKKIIYSCGVAGYSEVHLAVEATPLGREGR